MAKTNLRRLPPSVGYQITFCEAISAIKRTNVADSPELSGRLSVRQRMTALLRNGPMTPSVLADEMEAKIETIERTARRYPQQFVVIPGGQLALLEKGHPMTRRTLKNQSLQVVDSVGGHWESGHLLCLSGASGPDLAQVPESNPRGHSSDCPLLTVRQGQTATHSLLSGGRTARS